MVSSTAPVFDQLPDGPVGRRHLLLSATRVVGDGIPGAAVIVTAVEVTVLCRALDQLAAEHRKAQAAVEARDWLLNQVSHELRTPLTPIMALADLLIHGQLDPEQVVRTGSTIFEAATHMRTVAEQILDLGRRQGTEPAGGNGEIELCELVETAAKLAGVPVLVQGAGQVVSDRLGLLQVLINLLANAEIHGRPPVWVTIRPGRHGVETIIRDHGPGIVDRQRGEIFERLTRRPGESSGAGLGLAIVREILDGLGGTITAGAPDDGGPGAVFTVTLPPPDNDPGKGTVIFLDRRERQLPGQAGRRVPGGIETARAPKGGCSG